MKAVVSLLLGLAAAWDREYTLDDIHAMDTLVTFKSWASEFERSYADLEEESHRYLIWLDNLYTIADYNSQDLTFKLRMNQFGDMTKDEFRHYVHGDNGACFQNKDQIVNIGGQDVNVLVDTPHEINANPSSIDWTNYNGKSYVTPVKNQGQCGSCWAFSATGAIECQYAIQNDGELNSLSEQQLVDCALMSYGCYGCNGGQMTGGMQYAADNGGLCSESEYPYVARDGPCHATTCGTKYDVSTGWQAVTKDSSAAMETAAAAGCISIGIEADQSAFQFYSSGVLTGTCGASIDHGVLVVGYGATSDGQQYWKVKNSWGTSWGEEGFVLICRNCGKNGDEGECGILTCPAIPTF